MQPTHETQPHSWVRPLLTGLCLLLALVCVSGIAAPVAYAQVEGEGDAETTAPAPKDAVAKGANDAAAEKVNYLSWAADSLGLFYGLVFLGLSFTLVALFVMNLLSARRENVLPKALIESFEQHLDAKKYQDAYDVAKNDNSFLGHVLSAGISKVSASHEEAMEAMEEVGEDENMRLEHRLSYLALIGTLSPMIGLLGTVDGMIGAFKTIANTATGAPDPQALAVGISTALFTTYIGLVIAIPALAAYNLLRNRITRLVLEVGMVSDGLMSRFQKKSL